MIKIPWIWFRVDTHCLKACKPFHFQDSGQDKMELGAQMVLICFPKLEGEFVFANRSFLFLPVPLIHSSRESSFPPLFLSLITRCAYASALFSARPTSDYTLTNKHTYNKTKPTNQPTIHPSVDRPCCQKSPRLPRLIDWVLSFRRIRVSTSLRQE